MKTLKSVIIPVDCIHEKYEQEYGTVSLSMKYFYCAALSSFLLPLSALNQQQEKRRKEQACCMEGRGESTEGQCQCVSRHIVYAVGHRLPVVLR